MQEYIVTANNFHNCKSYSCVFVENLAIIGDCAGTYDDIKNEITTPNYPSPYPTNKECKWIIEVAQGKRIELEFESFDLESHQRCDFDWLKVYDGGKASSRSLKNKYCGEVKPNTTVSTANKLFLKWHSDQSTTRLGFKISASLKGK